VIVFVGTVASADHQLGQAGLMRPRPARVPAPRSGFAGFRFPPDIIMVAVLGTCGMGSPSVMLRSCWPNAGSRSIT
jgi:hypothetical protein